MGDNDIALKEAVEYTKKTTLEELLASIEQGRERDRKQDRKYIKHIKRWQMILEKHLEDDREADRVRWEKIERESEILDAKIKQLSENIGGVNNKLGRLTEIMFSCELWRKFENFGFAFDKQGANVSIAENGKKIAELDFLLENGDYAMPVEVKTDLRGEDIDRHIKRIEKIRGYWDRKGDKRKLVGAMASAVAKDDVLEYAHNNGIFVFVQTGDTVKIADLPSDFKAREW